MPSFMHCPEAEGKHDPEAVRARNLRRDQIPALSLKEVCSLYDALHLENTGLLPWHYTEESARQYLERHAK